LVPRIPRLLLQFYGATIVTVMCDTGMKYLSK